MNHKQERLDILKMIQDGTITAEEGAKLLAFFPIHEATMPVTEDNEPNPHSPHSPQNDPSRHTEAPKKKRPGLQIGKTLGKFEKEMEAAAVKLESGLESTMEKVEHWATELEHDIRESMGDRTGKVVVVNGLGDLFGLFRQHRMSERLVSAPVEGSIKTLSLFAKNGPVSIKGHDDPHVVITCEYSAKKADAEITLVEKDGKIRLAYDDSQIKHMEIRCKVPYGSIIEDLKVENRNGQILIEDVTCDTVHLDTSNALIRCENLAAQYAKMDTSNAPIKVMESTIRKLDMDTSNAKIELDIPELIFDNQVVYASTSNSTINFLGPRELTDSQGLWVNADTTNGQVTNNLHYLTHTVGRAKRNNEMNIQSVAFEQATKKLKVNMDTTNASIRIGH